MGWVKALLFRPGRHFHARGDVRQMSCWNAGPAATDRAENPRLRRLQRDGDVVAGPGVFERVIQDIGENLPQPVRVAEDGGEGHIVDEAGYALRLLLGQR